VEVQILKVIYEKNKKRKPHKGNDKDWNFVDFVFVFGEDC